MSRGDQLQASWQKLQMLLIQCKDSLNDDHWSIFDFTLLQKLQFMNLINLQSWVCGDHDNLVEEAEW